MGIHSEDWGEYSLAYTVFGAINTTAAFFVLVTFMIWPETLYQTKKGSKFGRPEQELNPFKGIILMIAVSVFLYCLTFSFGFPKDETLCEAQGVLVNIATRAIYFWNTCLSYKIYQVMVVQEEGMSFALMNIITWGLNILLAVLPLATGAEYGIDAPYLGKLMCYFKQGGQALTVWVWITFFVPQMLCLLIMTTTNLALARRFKYLSDLSNSNPKERPSDISIEDRDGAINNIRNVNTVTKSLKKVVWGFTTFPIVMIAISLPNIIVFIVVTSTPSFGNTEAGLGLSQVMFLWTCVYGIVLVFLFLYTMKECRRKWATLLCGYTFPTGERVGSGLDTLDDFSDDDSEYSYSVEENNSKGIGMTRYSSDASNDVGNPVHSHRDESLFSDTSEFEYRSSTDSDYRGSERVSQMHEV